MSSASAGAANPAPIKLRMGHVVNPGSIFDLAAHKFADLVQEKTKGQVEVQVFPSGQLGQERDAIQGMPLGVVDLYIYGTSTLSAVVPEVGDSDLPYLYRNKEHADKVLEGEVGQHWLQLLETRGIKGLGWGAGGFRSSLNNRKPITKEEDFAGMKFRIAGGPNYIGLYKALGANPIQMTWNEVYTAMQQKVIDGLEAPPNVLLSAKLYEVGKYLTLDEHTYSALAIGMAMPTFRKLSPEHQKIMLEAGREAARFMRDQAEKLDQASVKEMQGKGVIVSTIEKGPLMNAVKPLYEELAMDKNIVAKIRAMQ